MALGTPQAFAFDTQHVTFTLAEAPKACWVEIIVEGILTVALSS
jgi:hypothetical protein